MSDHLIIALNREYGSGGKEIAEKLGKRLTRLLANGDIAAVWLLHDAERHLSGRGTAEYLSIGPHCLAFFKWNFHLAHVEPLKTASFMMRLVLEEHGLRILCGQEWRPPAGSAPGIEHCNRMPDELHAVKEGLELLVLPDTPAHCVSNVIITTVSAFSLPTTKPEPFSASSVKNSSALRSVGTDGFFGQRLS